MSEFESTLEDERPRSRICVVYERDSRRVVHVHEFIGDEGFVGTAGDDARGEIALEAAGRRHEPSGLAFFHAPEDVRIERGVRLRIDVEAKRIETVPGTVRRDSL